MPESRAALLEKYFKESRERLNRLESLLKGLQADPSDGAALQELQSIFHNFAGSGALYGAPEVGTLGGEGEYMCSSIAMGGREPSPAELAQVLDLVRKTRSAFQSIQKKAESRLSALKQASSRSLPMVLIVGTGQGTCAQLGDYLGKRGFQVARSDDPVAAVVKLEETAPDVVAVETSTGRTSGYEVVRRIRELESSESVPILLFGVNKGFLDKVEAIACGADAFVEGPFDPERVLSRLRGVLAHKTVVKGRVLAVEDDPPQAHFLETSLSEAGFDVRVLLDPGKFEEELHAFRPDLVLMDVLLPKVSGYTLVRFLRQEEGFSALPVIFLTTEARREAQVKGAEAGGDDFLVKPVSARELTATVRSRLLRHRALQEMMDHDDLTGFLAHTPFLQQAHRCLGRFHRGHATFALALLKVDNLKGIVSRLGPKAGDILLQDLARFLRRKIRQTDILGRFSEDVAAILLERLTARDAVRLMQRLEGDFSKLEHRVASDPPFKATFSVGIALASAKNKTLKSWLDEASAALKNSIAQGGHRVSLAPPPKPPPAAG